MEYYKYHGYMPILLNEKHHVELYYALTKIIPCNYAWIQEATWKKANTKEITRNFKVARLGRSLSLNFVVVCLLSPLLLSWTQSPVA